MRSFDRVVLRTLSLALVGAGFIVACSSSNGDDPGSGRRRDGSGRDPARHAARRRDAGRRRSPQAVHEERSASPASATSPSSSAEAATCKDGVKNASETDLDCGGSCPKCATAKKCKVAGDWRLRRLQGHGQGPRVPGAGDNDGVKNGTRPASTAAAPATRSAPTARAARTAGLHQRLLQDRHLHGDPAGRRRPERHRTDVGLRRRGQRALRRRPQGASSTPTARATSARTSRTAWACAARSRPRPTARRTHRDRRRLRRRRRQPRLRRGEETASTPATARASAATTMNKCAVGRSCTQRYGGDTCGFAARAASASRPGKTAA